MTSSSSEVAPKTSSSSDVPPMISSSSFEVLSETRSSSEVHPHTFSSSSAFVAPAGNETVSDADIDVDLTTDPEGFESDDLDSDIEYEYPCCRQEWNEKTNICHIECSQCLNKYHVGPLNHCSGENTSKRLALKIGYKHTCKRCWSR